MPSGAMSVFIVEDDADDTLWIERAVRETLPGGDAAGVRFRFFKDGVEFLEFLLGEDGGRTVGIDPVLVISDLNMPRMNGLELLEAIRASRSWSGLPFVLLTACLTPEIVLYAHRSGVSSVVAKSSNWSQFRRNVGGALKKFRREAARLPSGRR